MSSLEAIVKNAEEIAIHGGEEIIEEVIEEEQVWMGQSEVMEQVQDEYYTQELLDHQLVEYEDSDNYQTFLPVRNGDAYFSLNLPDLLSKPHQFTQDNGQTIRLVSCFNKRCQRQVACNGNLYTIKDYVSDSQWNTWRCINEACFGEIRTTPEFTEIRECTGHLESCTTSDELQVAIRIAVYDARLLAEFTDVPLENLYVGALERIKTDYPEGALLFPSFAVIKSTLVDHRTNKIYRKRFEMQKFRDKQKKMNMTPDELLYAENSSGMIKFRRTKPFPPSYCNECTEQFISTNLPSQDQLVAHYMYTHNRRMTIERFEFKDLNSFDQYLRELNIQSRFKMKKMGLADEHMYYLCAHDDRLAKTGIGRASRLQQQNCHCTAFIRIFDWRIVSKREGSRITIDYCLEHQPHVYEPEYHQPRHIRGQPITAQTYSKEYIDYYTPEVFLRDLEDRRIRSQKIMLGDLTLTAHSDRSPTKRQIDTKSYIPHGRMKASFGARSLAPPMAAQLAGGVAQPFVDCYGDMESPMRRMKFRQPMRSFKPEEQESEQAEPSNGGEDPAVPPPRIYITQKPYTRMTERQNFKDIYTFNAICKVEDTCLNLLNRLQSCQNARIGLAYREKIAAILRNANSDPGLVDGSTLQEMEQSWVFQKPLRGRPRKRVRMEGEVDEEEEEDVEMEEVQEETQQEQEEVPEEQEDQEERIQEDHEREEKDIPLIRTESSSPKPEEMARVERSVSTSSQGELTRSGRSRKVPARLLGE